MATSTFKVRRQLRVMRAASFYNTVGADGGFTTPSGSVSTFSGGLTAASLFTVSGSAVIGTGGTTLSKILTGSLAVTQPLIEASIDTGTVDACITGLSSSGANYKWQFTATSAPKGSVLVSAVASANSPSGVFTFTFANTDASDDTAACEVTLHYLGILDY